MMECKIPMSVFRSSPISLKFDQLITATVAACNRNGCSQFSPLNTIGAKVQTEPLAPSLPKEGLLTTETQIHVTWFAQTTHKETQGATVLSYHIRWDKS